MSNLTKSTNGLLFYDDFSEKTLMWTVSPSNASNALEFGENGLRIKHSEKYVIYTLVEPEVEEYSCIIQLDHVPFNYEDIAGIIVMSSNKEYAECQSFLATEPSEITNPSNALSDFVDVQYKYIKFIKTKYKYVFYASADSYEWIEVGNATFDRSATIGFFVYSSDNQDVIDNSHCYFNNFALYASKYICINGIERKSEIEMLDENNALIFRTDSGLYKNMISRSNKTCMVNTNTLPMPIKNAKIRVYAKNNYSQTISEYNLGDIYGGDEYTITQDIRIHINNKEINSGELYDLGSFYSGSYFVKFAVHNHDEDIASVKVKVIGYSEYYSGEENIELALYDENKPQSSLEYKKELVIENIKPSEGRILLMRLSDRPVPDFYKTANSYRFKIIIE